MTVSSRGLWGVWESEGLSIYQGLQSNSVMQEDIKRANDLYDWNRRGFTILGAWPLNRTYARFTIWSVYIAIHITLEMADMIQVFGNLELMILNLLESALAFMIFVKLMVMRYSRTLRKIMVQIIDSIDDRYFEDPEEKEIYMKYNHIAKSFFTICFRMALGASIFHFIKPLELRLKSVLSSENMPFVLPYRTRLFFEINDSTTFWLICVYQSPMIYVNSIFAINIGYVFSIVLHVCGQLAVLAYRIKSLDFGPQDDDPHKSRLKFRDIVETHRNILGIAKDIENVFHLVLLEELSISTVIVGLTAYSVFASAEIENTGVALMFLLYGITMLFLIYGYCVAGEYLITESNNVHEAYYQCRWYDWSSSSKKHLTICMLGAIKPIQLTGGGFYIFSSAGFTNVLKTAMGYISMLRTVV